MKKDKLSRLWWYLQQQKEPMKLEKAIKNADFEWHDEGGGGNDELEAFIRGPVKKWQKKIVRHPRNKRVIEDFIMSRTFWKLNILKEKTKHPAIDTLFGPGTIFGVLNWKEMSAARDKTDPQSNVE